MIGRNFTVKSAKNFSEHNAKKFVWKFHSISEKS